MRILKDKTLVCLRNDEVQYLRPHKGNRLGDGVKQHHVKKLVKDILEFGFLKQYAIPIHTNWEMQDGHHRRLAALQIDSEVWVSVDNTHDFYILNRSSDTSQKWSTNDWVNHYASLGKSEYIVLKRIFDLFPNVCKKVLISLCSGVVSQPSESLLTPIRNGKFRFKNGISEFMVVTIVNQLTDLWNLVPMDVRGKKKGKKINMSWSYGWLWLRNQSQYNHNAFVRSIMGNRQNFYPQGNEAHNRYMMVDIWNYKKQTKNRITA